MTDTLKPCPCGKTPEKLHISEGDTFRWRIISPSCCGEWNLEARIDTAHPERDYEICVETWNDAPRA